MIGSLLERFGIWTMAAAVAAILFSTQVAPGSLSPANVDIARHLAVAGALAAGVGYLLERAGRAHCPRCGHTAMRGSVFCTTHRGDLGRATREAVAAHRRDNRLE